MQAVYTDDLATCIQAAVAEYANKYPSVINFVLGSEKYTFAGPIEPAIGEPEQDFADRVATAVNTAIQANLTAMGLTDATFTPVTCTFSTDGATNFFLLSPINILTNNDTDLLPISSIETVGSSWYIGAGVSIRQDRSAMINTIGTITTTFIGSAGLPANWNSSVNKFPGSPYAGRE